MKLSYLFMVASLVLLSLTGVSACTSEIPAPQPVPLTPPSEATEPTEAGFVSEPGALQYEPKLATAKNEFFATSGTCAACHQNIQAEQAQDVSFDSLWRSTSMANAARDPYFLATVRSEITHLPELREVIEDKCATCHLSMAHFVDKAQGRTSQIFDEGGYLDPAHPNHALGKEGVSCTVCHQIRADNFGEESSFSGGMSFDLQNSELRTVYGARPAEAATVMEAIGYAAEQSEHIRKSELCATCHMLYTPYVTSEGQISDTLFPEQTPYLEWLASDYASTNSCQDCHMPKAAGPAQISNLTQTTYEGVALHTFVGGNAVLLGMLKDNADEIQPTAEIGHFTASIHETEIMLTEQTAQIIIENTAFENGILSFDVEINILTGHKFPSSFPSRRAWLHLTVTDNRGQVVFESGGMDGAMIVGNDNDLDEHAYEPHYESITNPDQVQIYESILGTDTGEVTTALLEAGQYLKDNRLLPRGFDKGNVSADIAVYGAAQTDENFESGGDTMRYEIPLSGEGFTVTVELRYQPIGYRWAYNLEEDDSAEAQDFMRYFDGLPYNSLLVAQAEAQVGP